MPREKPLFRRNLERLDEKFPDKELLSYDEVATYLQKSKKTVSRIFGERKTGNSISKARVADFLS